MDRQKGKNKRRNYSLAPESRAEVIAPTVDIIYGGSGVRCCLEPWLNCLHYPCSQTRKTNTAGS